MNEEKVLIQIDELRLAIKNCYMRSRLVRLDHALADGDCKGVLLELDMLDDYAVTLKAKLRECKTLVAEIQYCGGFSHARTVKSHERSTCSA